MDFFDNLLLLFLLSEGGVNSLFRSLILLDKITFDSFNNSIQLLSAIQFLLISLHTSSLQFFHKSNASSNDSSFKTDKSNK